MSADITTNETPLQQLGRLLSEAGAVMTLTLTGGEWRDLLAHHTADLKNRAEECAEGFCDPTEARWQTAIYEALRKRVPRPDDIDGSGCDSGDALDLTLSEIAQALNQIKDQAEEAKNAATAIEAAKEKSDLLYLELQAELAREQQERIRWSEAEHSLSAAYIRLRGILGAVRTPDAPTAEQVWAHTEDRAKTLVADLERLRGNALRTAWRVPR